jgi:P4 family phage/plasmid primase-like protien
MKRPHRDWAKIRAHYESSGESLRQVAARFGIPERTVFRRSATEGWVQSGSASLVNGSAAPSTGSSALPGAGENGSRNGTAPSDIGSAVTQTGSNPLPETTKNGSANGTEHSGIGSAAAQTGNDPLPEATKNGSANGPGHSGIGSAVAQIDPLPEAIENGTAEPEPENGTTPGAVAAPSIPANINLWSRRESALYYHRKLGWAIHALYAFDQGTETEKGKKPLQGGWRHHTAAKVKRKYIDSHFGADTKFNLGVIVRPPYVAVDLDSKEDNGESVRAWLAPQPELAAVPRERTGGGAHLHFRCLDLPETLLTQGNALTVKLADKVMAELYSNGLNLVLSPSIHKTEHRYFWEVTGEIPEVKWADLSRWFGFPTPTPQSATSKGKRRSRNWRTAYRGDVESLDLAALFKEADMLGDCLDPDQGKWAVRCPWECDHSGHPNAEPASDTVIFASGSLGFRCLHAHCSERSLEDVCLWFDCREPGIVDRLCARLRPDIAAALVGEDAVDDIWQEGANATDLVTRHGDPFVWKADRFSGEQTVVDFNHHYWATRYSWETLLLFDPYTSKFHHYHDLTGLWRWVTEFEVRGDLSTYLLGHSRRLGQPILDTGRTAERLASMTGVLKAQSARRMAFKRNGDVIHLANGMLHIDSDPLKLKSFAPGYFSVRSCPVTFDEEALCPRFLRELVLPAMGREDAELLQIMGGLFLTGRNSWQKILVFCGTGGSGKGTIARILQRLVGMQHVKQLRTRLLDDRFELDNLDQATLLVGSDVDGDFLSCRGAKVIKALTGGDPLTVETKGGGKRDITGEHNVLITCNDRLQVKLDGDESAWKRRLLIIDFNRPAGRQIDDFDRVLIEEEGSGIFNFFLVGAARLKEISREGGRFPISPSQEDRVETLLAESDSLRLFIKQNVIREEGASLTTEEILYAYENFCSEHNWTAVAKRRFEQQLGPLMMEFHRAGKRNDIARGSTPRRGFRHVRLAPEESPAASQPALEPAFLLPE